MREMQQLRVLEIDHINQLIDNADRAVEHYERVYGATVAEVFRQRTGPYDNFIFKMGAMTLEVFSPVDPEYSFGRQHHRFGNCWQGCLLRVPDLREAIEACERRGIPLVDVNLERGWAFTDPRATYFSIQLEDRDDWDKTTTENSAGILGLQGFSVVVPDAREGVAFFTSLLADAEILYEEARPALHGRATGILVAGYVLEIQSPSGDGELSEFLDRYRPRIRTATWRVSSLEDLERGLAAQGIRLLEGDRDGAVAIAPADNLGLSMQFVE
jgi:hypothetical protein